MLCEAKSKLRTARRPAQAARALACACARSACGLYAMSTHAFWGDEDREAVADAAAKSMKLALCTSRLDEWCTTHCTEGAQTADPLARRARLVFDRASQRCKPAGWTPPTSPSGNASDATFCGNMSARARGRSAPGISHETLVLAAMMSQCQKEQQQALEREHIFAGRWHVPQCALLLLPHVPKTGGTNVFAVLGALPGWWIVSRSSEHKSLGAELGWSNAPCAAALRPRLSERGAAGSQLHAPNANAPVSDAAWSKACPGPWRSRRVMAHFNDPLTTAVFHSWFAPRLASLRQMYKSAGCAFGVGLTLRKPAPHIISSYQYFRIFITRHHKTAVTASSRSPIRHNATLQVDDFAAWLHSGANPQLAWLVNERCSMVRGCSMLPSEPSRGAATSSSTRQLYTPWPLRDGATTSSSGVVDVGGGSGSDGRPRLDACTSAGERSALQRALRLMTEVDVVGTSEHLNEFIWALAARVGVFFQSHHQGEGQPPACRDSRCNAATSHSGLLFSLPSLPPVVASLLSEQTQCDEILYAEARRREALGLQGTARLLQALVEVAPRHPHDHSASLVPATRTERTAVVDHEQGQQGIHVLPAHTKAARTTALRHIALRDANTSEFLIHVACP